MVWGRCHAGIGGEEIENPEPEDEQFSDEEEPDYYYHDFRSEAPYGFVSDLIPQSASFRQVQAHVKSVCHYFLAVQDVVLHLSSGEAAVIVRLNALDGPQGLRDVLASTFAYPIASDASNNIHGTAYFSLRVRLSRHTGESVRNLHVVALPLYEKHTEEYLAKLTEKVFQFLNIDWRAKVVGVVSDGARSITGVRKGWQTRIEATCHEDCDSVFYRVWCANHQIELVDESSVAAMIAVSPMQDGLDCMPSLHEVVKFLRKQFYLIESMGGKSPYRISEWWGSIGNVVKWYTRHNAVLAEYLNEHDEELGEQTSWWLQTPLVTAHIKIVCSTMKETHGKGVLVYEHSLTIQDRYKDMLELYDLLGTEKKHADGGHGSGREQSRAFELWYPGSDCRLPQR